MKKLFLILLLATVLTSVNAATASAAGIVTGTPAPECVTIYGGGENEPCVTPAPKEVEVKATSTPIPTDSQTSKGGIATSAPRFDVNKTVQNPQTKVYVNNLSEKDPKYKQGQIVLFKLTVKNTGQDPVSFVVIKDVFPEVVEFSGGVGNFDVDKRTLTINLEKLESGEQRDFYVMVKVKPTINFPKNKDVVCVTNSTSITAQKKVKSDKARFCIEKGEVAGAVASGSATTKGGQSTAPKTPVTKGGLPVYPPTKATTTPPTGPAEWSLIGLIPTAISGFVLRRKSK